jgi:hypothetical protein
MPAASFLPLLTANAVLTLLPPSFKAEYNHYLDRCSKKNI